MLKKKHLTLIPKVAPSLAWRLGPINTPIPVLDLEVLVSIPRGDPASSLVPCTPPPWIKYNLDLGLLGTEVSGAALGDGWSCGLSLCTLEPGCSPDYSEFIAIQSLLWSLPLILRSAINYRGWMPPNCHAWWVEQGSLSNCDKVDYILESLLQSITFFPVYYSPLESLLWSFCWPDLLLWYLAGVSACVKWLHHGHSALCQCTRQCAPRSAPSLAQQCAPEGFCTRAAVHQHCPCRPPTTVRKLTNSAKA